MLKKSENHYFTNTFTVTAFTLGLVSSTTFKYLIMHYKVSQSVRRLALPASLSLQADDTDFKQAVVNAN